MRHRCVLLALLVLPLVSGCGSGGHSITSAREALASQVQEDIPRWIEDERLPAAATAGARVFATAGCTTCHTYDGAGATNLNAPDLTAIGAHHLGIRFRIAHLKCPSCVHPGSPMPPFGSLGAKRLHELAIFLEASKGKQ